MLTQMTTTCMYHCFWVSLINYLSQTIAILLCATFLSFREKREKDSPFLPQVLIVCVIT